MRRLRIAIGLLASLLLLGLALTATANTAPTGTHSWSYLVDASARLSLEEVRAQRQQFKPLSKQSFTFPPSDHAVWLRAEFAPQQQPAWLWIFDLLSLHSRQILQTDGVVLHVLLNCRCGPTSKSIRHICCQDSLCD